VKCPAKLAALKKKKKKEKKRKTIERKFSHLKSEGITIVVLLALHPRRLLGHPLSRMFASGSSRVESPSF
jgi:hypothetical protein